MWAVDYPYQETVEATQWLNDAPISDADKEKIFHRTPSGSSNCLRPEAERV